MQLTAEQEQQERENGDLLASIGNVDAQVARRVLRKHKGDMEKAADALLAGDRGMDVWDQQHKTTPEPMYSDGLNTATPITSITPLPSSSVIDLTADDDDMTHAIQMSMQDYSQTTPQFGPSERAPHPEWQMVRSNAPAATSTNQDRILDDAIQASLQDFKEDTDLSPFKHTVREGNRPIALRPEKPALAYAALVLQALYYVPQVRSTVSTLRLPSIDPRSPLGAVDRAMWNLIELFTNMDLAQLATIVDNELIPSLDILPFEGTQGLLGDTSAAVVRNIAQLIEQHMLAQAQASGLELEESDRLFSFTHGRVTVKNKVASKLDRSAETGVVVSVDCGGDSVHNDLISCVSDILTKYAENGSSTHDVIITPSEVIGFEIRRSPNLSGKASPDPFIYPKTIYLDRFLFDNIRVTNERRAIERRMMKDIKDLTGYKEKLTRHNNRDTLQDLRSSIHYYEHVADQGDDLARQYTLERTANHLKDIMTMILGKVEDIDHQLEELRAEVAVVYDCPELQQFQYDLRAVLVHTGLPGRKQMYSYVQDFEGTWWKTVDHEVTEVLEETVLTDPTGIHLGAGPYLLFYSRHLTDEQMHEPLVWPSIFSEAVAENNKTFLAMMHPELGIFATSSPEVVAPTPRELPEVPIHNRSGRTVSRDNSRSMAVDDGPH